MTISEPAVSSNLGIKRFATMSPKILILSALIATAVALVEDGESASVSNCNLAANVKEEIQSYKEVAAKIIDAVTQGDFKGTAYDDLGDFPTCCVSSILIIRN